MEKFVIFVIWLINYLENVIHIYYYIYIIYIADLASAWENKILLLAHEQYNIFGVFAGDR